MTEGIVILSESEKDADNLHKLGFIAVSSGGANSWRSEFSELLRALKIVIMPHHDEPGMNYAKIAANSLKGVAASVKVIDAAIFGSSKGADVSDWIQAGGIKDQLLKFIEATPEWTQQVKTYPIINSIDLIKSTDSERIEWLWEGAIPAKSINGISAEPGSFKTWLSQYLSKAIAEGIPFLGRNTQKTKVTVFDRENSKFSIRQRLSLIGTSINLDFYPKWVRPELPPLMVGCETTEGEDGVYLHYAKEGRLIIFDSLTRFHTFEENSATEMKAIFDSFQKLVNAGATVLFLHHKGKSETNEYRGSSEIKAGVDCLFTLKREKTEAGNFLKLQCVKHRFISDDFSITMKINKVDNGVTFEDATEYKQQLRELEEKDRIDAVKEAMITHYNDMGEHPNQSQLVEKLRGKLGRDAIRELLTRHEGVHWMKEAGSGHEKVYIPSEVFSDFTDTYSSRKSENQKPLEINLTGVE